MNVRFFADWGPDGKSRVLIGISRPTDDRGELSEAVRVATEADQAAYPDAYEAYRATMQTAPWVIEQPAEAASTETAEEGQSEEGSGRHRGRRSSASEEG